MNVFSEGLEFRLLADLENSLSFCRNVYMMISQLQFFPLIVGFWVKKADSLISCFL